MSRFAPRSASLVHPILIVSLLLVGGVCAPRGLQAAEILAALASGEDTAAAVAALREGDSTSPHRTHVEPLVPAAASYVEAVQTVRAAVAKADARAVRSGLTRLAAADLIVREELDRAAALTVGGRAGVLAERVAAARGQWDRAHAQLVGAVTKGPSGSRETPTGDEESALARRAILGADLLPVHRPRMLPRPPRLVPNVLPSYASGGEEVSPLAEDLASGADATLSPAILGQAQALGYDYIAIADFVRTQVRTQWYAGAQKDAEETLRTRAGNDADQASLLIALLRASSAPSRYVTGVVEVPVADLALQIGVAEARVGVALASAGIAHAPVTSQGRVSAFRIEHVWVATYVPYGNYRGSSADTGSRSWIPLMPALKPAHFVAAQPALSLAGIDSVEWTRDWPSAVRTELPWPSLRTELGARLAQQQPPRVLDALRAELANDSAPLSLLPASTPYPVAAVNLEHAELLDEQRQWLRLRLRDAAAPDRVALDLTLPVSQLASRRIGLGYTPATVEDQHLVNARGGPGEVPLHLLRVRPSIWVDGRPAATGSGELPAGTLQSLEIELKSAAGSVTATQQLRAGGIAALAFDPQGDAPAEEPAGASTPSEPAASRALSAFARRYLHEWSTADAELAATLGVTVLRPLPAATLAIADYHVDEVNGLDHGFRFRGVALDALARPVEPVAQGTDHLVEAAWLRLSALHGSALEHAVFEAQWGVESVSADKLLADAVGRGVPRLQLEMGDDAATQLPLHSTTVRDAVQDWLDLGLDVEITRDPLTFEDWSGSAWRVSNPETGESGYFISGGLAGGYTAIDPDRWLIRDLAEAFANPYAGEPNTDRLATALLQLDASAQAQQGIADQLLEKPLIAYVTDEIGRPVEGARVQFALQTPGGQLITQEAAGEYVVAISNERGIASVQLKLPDQFAGPTTELRFEGLAHAQTVGISLVAVQVETHRGALATDAPYHAYALPDAPYEVMLRNLLPQFPLVPGLSFRDFEVYVRDRNGLLISNAEVDVSVEDTLPTPQCTGHGIEAAPRSALFVGDACPPGRASYHGEACTSATVQTTTHPDGATVNLVPTTVMQASVRVIARTPGVDVGGNASTLEAVEQLTTAGTIRGSAGQQCSEARWLGTVQWYWPLLGDTGQLATATYDGAGYGVIPPSLEVARPGETFATSRRVSSVLGNGRGGIAWTGFTAPAVTAVELSGALAANPRRDATGFEYDLVAGPEAGRVEGSVRFTPPLPFEGVRAVTIPLAHVIETPPPDVAPQPLPVNDFGRSDAPLRATAPIRPAAFVARDIAIEFLEDGAVFGRCGLSRASGGSECAVGQGAPFVHDRAYAARYSLNHGTPYFMQSAESEVKLGRGLIVGYGVDATDRPLSALHGEAAHSPFLTLRHVVDIPNAYYCAVSSRFFYVLAQPARVTITFYDVDAQRSRATEVWQPVDGEPKAAGVHELQVHPADLPLGEFRLEILAVAADGSTESAVAAVDNAIERSDSLPLAHSFVKGVDLFDGKGVLSTEDVAIGGRGPGLSFSRTYSSHAGHELGMLGRGWSSDIDSRIVADRCGVLSVTGGAGQGQRFASTPRDAAGEIHYTPLHGYHGSLIRRASGAFDFYSKNGTRYHFARDYVRGTRLSFIEDANGNRVRYEYRDLIGGPHVSRIVDDAGRVLHFDYDVRQVAERDTGGEPAAFTSRAMLVQLRGPFGLRLQYEYDGYGNLVRVRRRPDGAQDGVGAPADVQRTVYRYEDFGDALLIPPVGRERLVRMGFRLVESRDDIDASRRTYAFERGWSGFLTDEGIVYVPELRVATLVEPDEGTTRFAYPGLSGIGGVRRTVIDARSQSTIYDLDRYGAVEVITDSAGTTRTAWDPVSLQPAVIVDALGNATRYSYDEHGNRISESVEHPSGALTRSWSYNPPSNFAVPIKDRVALHIDARAIETRTAWDERGNLLGVTRGGSTESFAIAINGDRESRTDGNGDVTRYTYDDFGHLVLEADDLGPIRGATFDVRGRQRSELDAAGEATTFEYDSRDRRVRIVPPFAPVGLDGAVARAATVVAYDDAARQKTEVDALGRETRTTLDAMGREVAVRNALGRTAISEYDRNGNRTLQTDFRGNETRYAYDAANRLVERLEPLGRVTRYAHDALGHVVAETTGRLDGGGTLHEARSSEYRYEHASYLRTHVRRQLDARWLETVSHYDANGNLVRVVDPRGFETRQVFDDRDRQTQSTQPEGRVVVVGYDGADRRVAETLRGPNLVEQRRAWSYDARGRERTRTDGTAKTWLTSYDLAGNVASRTDPLGHGTHFSYDANHRLARVAGPVPGREQRYGYDAVGQRIDELHANGRRIRHDYDPLGRLISSRDLEGDFSPAEFQRTAYDHDGNVMARRDGNGNETTFEVDALGRVVAEHRPLNRDLGWTHTIHGEVASETDAEAATTVHEYDMLGRRTRTIAPSPFGYVTVFGHDDGGNLVSQTNGRGFTTTWTYDGLGRRTTQVDPPEAHTDPARRTQSWIHDAAGNVVAQTDRRGIGSATAFDGENRPTQRSADGVVKATLHYDAAGNVDAETDANGHVTQHAYNAANERLSTTRPDAGVELRSYFPWGGVEKVTDADGVVTEFAYDLRQRVISESVPDPAGAAITRHAYDGHGNRTASIRPMGDAWRWQYLYDAAHRLSAVVSPIGARTEYGYDRADRRLTIDDAERRVTTTTLDALGRPIRVDHPNGDHDTVDRYDASNNVELRQDGNRQAIESAHDALDRVERRRWSGPSQPTDVVEERWQYDPDGRITRVEQAQADAAVHVVQRTWDRQGRLEATTDRYAQVTENAYDAQDNRVVRDDAAGRTVHAYDRANRLRSVHPEGEAAISIEPTPAGRLAAQTAPNGAVTEHAYDVSGRIATITHRQSGVVVATYTYAYDRNGNRASEVQTTSDGTRTTTYDYDRDDRLTGTTAVDEAGVSTRTTYTLDGVGNRLTEIVSRGGTTVANKTYGYNARHQLTEVDDSIAAVTTTYTYDGNGFMTSETTNGQTTTYRPNLQDRLATLTTPTGPPVQYAYDVDGLRVEKRSTATATRFGWDGTTLRRETNVANNPLVDYDWAAGRVLRSRDGGQTGYAQHDALKSATRWSRGDGGLLASVSYDAWGMVDRQSGVLPAVRYTGYYADAESSNYYAQQRYYLPGVGRFNRVDPWAGDALRPITLSGKHLYANSNPLRFLDPDGLVGTDSILTDLEFAAAVAPSDGSRRIIQAAMADQVAGGDPSAIQAAGGAVVGLGQMGLEAAEATAQQTRALNGNPDAIAQQFGQAQQLARALAEPRQTARSIVNAQSQAFTEIDEQWTAGKYPEAGRLIGKHVLGPVLSAFAPWGRARSPGVKLPPKQSAAETTLSHSLTGSVRDREHQLGPAESRGHVRAVVTEATTLSQQRILARIARESRSELMGDYERLASMLTHDQLQKLRTDPFLLRPFFGSAIEQLVDAKRLRDPTTSELYWTGVSNKPRDWYDQDEYGFELTGSSPRSILDHQRRPEVNVVITYDSITSSEIMDFHRWLNDE